MRREGTVMAADRFEQLILDRLSGLGKVTARPLFGGHGIYWDDTIFAIVYGGRLYLKVDEGSKGDYLARGMGPFRPNERQTLKSYFEVPSDVLADREALLSWTREAIQAGMDSRPTGLASPRRRALRGSGDGHRPQARAVRR